MTKEQEKAIETLKKFKDNELQRDKLELNRTGGWKIGDIYKFLELNPAIETVLSMLKEKDKEIEHWKNGFERELEDNRKNTCELLKQDLVIRKKDKQIDLMADYMIGGLEDVAFNSICKKSNCIYELKDNRPTGFKKCKDCIKQYFENKAKE